MRWTDLSLYEAIADLRARRGDTTELEVKTAAHGCPDLTRTFCAFANMPEGGTILLGLDESRGFEPVGLSDIASLEQGIASQARNAVDPPVRCEFLTLKVEGLPVLLCEVSALPLQDRPARTGGQAYLRQSDGDYSMSEQEIAQIELSKTQAIRRTHPDAEAVPGTSVDDLGGELTAAILGAARAASSRHRGVSDAGVLERLGVLDADGRATVAGLYAAGNYPQQYLRSLGVTAAVVLPPGSGARTRDLAHFDGPIPALLDEAMEWVRRNTRSTVAYDSRGHGIDRDELPIRAVREIIANALVHRNLDPVTDSKRVEVRLLDDQLIITSPGGLWGVSEQQLGQPNGKSAVNLTLYDLCKLVRLPDGSRVIEGEGGGIREAILAMREAGLRAPVFVDAGVRFTVFLSRHSLIDEADLNWLAGLPQIDGLSSEQRSILASMRYGTEWTNAKVREEFAPIDSVVARRILQQLVDSGLVEMTGSRGSATYALTEGIAGAVRAEGLRVSSAADVPQAVVDATRNGPLVWQALAAGGTVRELVVATRLSERQVRYTLLELQSVGLVMAERAGDGRTLRYARSPARV